MKFTIEIELGNAAMRNRTHIAEALQAVARKIVTPTGNRRTGDSGKIMDANGNSVGEWKFE